MNPRPSPARAALLTHHAATASHLCTFLLSDRRPPLLFSLTVNDNFDILYNTRSKVSTASAYWTRQASASSPLLRLVIVISTGRGCGAGAGPYPHATLWLCGCRMLRVARSASLVSCITFQEPLARTYAVWIIIPHVNLSGIGFPSRPNHTSAVANCREYIGPNTNHS